MLLVMWNLGTTNPLNTLQVGLGNSSLTVVSTASTIMVGVGTTNPQRTFDMKGDGNVEGSFNVDGSLSVNQSAVNYNRSCDRPGRLINKTKY